MLSNKVFSRLVLGGLLAAGATALWVINDISRHQVQSEWETFQQKVDDRLSSDADFVSDKFRDVYESLRTISFLPSVRTLNGVPMEKTSDSRATIQQLYNNLVNNFDVSEVYILSSDFNPDRLDPQTGKFQEPLAAFDEFIVYGGKLRESADPFAAKRQLTSEETILDEPEVEAQEYELMREQIAYFASGYPEIKGSSRMDTPMISDKEIITCDNREFNLTKNDADRKGIVFSVPFYDQNNKFAGMVSAIIRTNAIKQLMTPSSNAISNPYSKFSAGASMLSTTSILNWRPSFFTVGKNEKFSRHTTFGANDPRGKWTIGRSFNTTDFYNSSEYKATRSFYLWSSVFAAAATLLAMFWTNSNLNRAKAMRYRATHDPLTNLPNRRLFEEQLQRAIVEAGRGKQQAVLYLDLDKFKLVNDTLGHHIGDEVLKMASARLLTCMRGTDTLARIGGDEFVVLFKDVIEVAHVMALATRIIEKIAEPMDIEGHEICIGTSIGIEMVTGSSISPSEVLRHADLALFRAKSTERGNYRFYETAMDAAREERRMLEADLRLALQRDEFIINYQPIVNAKSSRMSGCEALIRWQHPTRGLVPPLSFIPLAEETGLINAIGEWVLKKACKDAMKLPKNIRIAVNLSPVQFRNPSLPLHVVTALNESGLPPGRLELEITEGLLLSQDESVFALLRQLRLLGVRIALDDFGVGYSSLGYLKTFKFDKIKIDRSFMCDIEKTKESAILKAITDMSSSMGMTTVAEGVETASQLNKVREQGCTEVQGYYFSKPVSIEALIGLPHNALRKA